MHTGVFKIRANVGLYQILKGLRRHLHDRRDLRSLCTGADKKRRYQRDRTRHRQRRTVK